MLLSQSQLSASHFYLAAFNRAPDLFSLTACTQDLDNGIAAKNVFSGLWSDPEVQLQFPDNASDADFITAAYQKIFNRTPDDEGRAYWTAKLTNLEHRSAVLYDIVEAGLTTPDDLSGKGFVINRELSTQYAVIQQLETGSALSANTLSSILSQVNEDPATISTATTRIDLACADQPELTTNQQAVCRIYLALFNRAPELAGLNNWTAELNAGTSVDALATQIYDLPTVKSLFPDSVPNRDFVIQSYKDLFNQSLPDNAGVDYWTAALDNHQSRGSLRLAMVDAASSNADGTEGKALITNRVESSQHATLTQLAQGVEIPVAHLADFMTQINDDHASVDSVSLAINAEIASLNDGGSDLPPEPVPTEIPWAVGYVPPPGVARDPNMMYIASTEVPTTTETSPTSGPVPTTEVATPVERVSPVGATTMATVPVSTMSPDPMATNSGLLAQILPHATEAPVASTEVPTTTETFPTLDFVPPSEVATPVDLVSPVGATKVATVSVSTPSLDHQATISEFLLGMIGQAAPSEAPADSEIIVNSADITPLLLIGQTELTPVV